MQIIMETSLEQFEAWSGAVDTLDTLIEKDLCDRLEKIIECDIFPDGCTDTELNDFLWFEDDYIAELLGYKDWESLENDGEEEEEEEEENNFSNWCNERSCDDCPYNEFAKMNDCEFAFYHDFPDMEDGIRLY